MLKNLFFVTFIFCALFFVSYSRTIYFNRPTFYDEEESRDVTKGIWEVFGTEHLEINKPYVLNVLSYSLPKPVDLEFDLKLISDENQTQDLNQKLNLKSNEFKHVVFDFSNFKFHKGELIISGPKANGTLTKNTINLHSKSQKLQFYIETDRIKYRPGETVNFRAIILNSELKPVPIEKKLEIFLKDENHNLIKKWKDLKLENGVYSGKYELHSSQEYGSYNLQISYNSDPKTYQKFSVEEYVLKNFILDVYAPEFILTSNYKLLVTVEAKYTHGNHVKGDVKLVIHQSNDNSLNSEFWPEFSAKDKIELNRPLDGKADFELNVLEAFGFKNNSENIRLEIEATVTDKFTNKNVTKSKFVNVIDKSIFINYVNNDLYIVPGTKKTIKLEIADEGGKPVIDEQNSFLIQYSFNKIFESQNFFSKNGKIEFQLDIPENAKHLIIRAIHKNKKFDVVKLNEPFKDTNEFIIIDFLNVNSTKNNKKHIDIGKKLQVQVLSSKPISAATLVVIKNEEIYLSKQIKFETNSKNNSFELDVSQDLAPQFTITLFYYNEFNNRIWDEKTIKVDNYLVTPIDVEVNKNITQPGQIVDLKVISKPGALIALAGIDQASLINHKTNLLNKNKLLNLLPNYDYLENYFPVYRFNHFFDIVNGRKKNDFRLSLHDKVSFPVAHSIEFKALNAEHVSLRKGGNKFADFDIQLREKFPETWIWKTEKINSSGLITFSQEIPDSITSWIIKSYAIDPETGISFSDDEKVTVFKPFFITLNLPDSLKRDEQVDIQVLVHNYQDKDENVTVTLFNEKNQFEIYDKKSLTFRKDNIVDEIQVKANSIQSVNYELSPTKIGNLILQVVAQTKDGKAGDKLINLLKIQPEGKKINRNKAFIVNVKDQSVNFDFISDFPENFVSDSRTITFSAVGDPLGLSINNLENLLRLPSGCGEQILSNFVPNLIVLEYLNNTGKLDEKLKKRAISNLEKGYVALLRNQHYDGSFSAFGESDKHGSTWLTAFVLKSFVKAKKYLPIQNESINKLIVYLNSTLNSTGEFIEYGNVFTKSLQGGLKDSKNSLGITAYVLAALYDADAKDKVNFTLIEDYLVKETQKIDLTQVTDKLHNENYYILSLVSYALEKITSDKKNIAFDKFWSLRTEKNDQLFFARRYNDEKKNLYSFYPYPEDVEASSYALLILNHREETGSALKILHWLFSKQNSVGGFSSTQDTVLALEAISEISKKLQSDKTDLQINVHSYDNKILGTFKIDEKNSIDVQKLTFEEQNYHDFKNLDKVSISAEGKGSAIIQISWTYHTTIDNYSSDFEVNVDVKHNLDENNKQDLKTFKLSTCVKYTKPGKTNMGIIELNAPSGYYFELSSKKKIINLNKVDIKNSDTKLIFYFDKFEEKETCLNVNGIQYKKVEKLKPALIEVYDYYNPGERKVIAYNLGDQLKDLSNCKTCKGDKCAIHCGLQN